MSKEVRYWFLFILTLIGSGAAGYTSGGWVSAIIAGSAAGIGLLQQSPGDPRRADT